MLPFPRVQTLRQRKTMGTSLRPTARQWQGWISSWKSHPRAEALLALGTSAQLRLGGSLSPSHW